MRTVFSAVTAAFLFTVVAFTACKKDNSIPNSSTLQNNYSAPVSLARMPDPGNLNSVKTFAGQTHSQYLAAALGGYNTGELSLENSVVNVNNQLTWSKTFFLQVDTPTTIALWNVAPDVVVNDYNSGTLAVMLHLNRFDALPPTLYKTYAQRIVDAVRAYVNGDETIDIMSICEQTFTQMSADPDLDDVSKQKLAAVIGVTEGSWTYWNAQIDTWPLATNYPNLSSVGFKATMSDRSKKVGLFLAADAMGALDGAAWGSAAPGVGTVAGAVCIGALYSGFAAWSW